MKNVVPVLVGVVIGVLAVFLGLSLNVIKWGAPPPPPPDVLPSPVCEATVKLSLASDGTVDGKKIVVDPPHPVCVALDRPVNWEIAGDATEIKEVKIEFIEVNGVYGPFPQDPGNTFNTSPGVYIRTDPGKLYSNKANATGSWKYWVRWTRPGDKLVELDPVVCIRN